MSSFSHTAERQLQRCDGPILTLLECDSNELLGTGWRKTMHKDDLWISALFHADVADGRGGTYRIRNVSKTGDVFMLRLSTVVIPEIGLASGHAVLEDYTLNRKHFPITNAVLKKGII